MFSNAVIDNPYVGLNTKIGLENYKCLKLIVFIISIQILILL